MDASSKMQRTCIITDKQSNQQVVNVTYLYLHVSYDICDPQWLSGKALDLISNGRRALPVVSLIRNSILWALLVQRRGRLNMAEQLLTGVVWHPRKQNLMAYLFSVAHIMLYHSYFYIQRPHVTTHLSTNDTSGASRVIPFVCLQTTLNCSLRPSWPFAIRFRASLNYSQAIDG